MEPFPERKKGASEDPDAVIRRITGVRGEDGSKAGTTKKRARMFGLANTARRVGIVIDGLDGKGGPMDIADP